jgi:hypothetical protein
MIDLFLAVVIHLTPVDPEHDCTRVTPCYNGHQPSYSDPDCWPGAIYCPPIQTAAYDERGHRK